MKLKEMSKEELEVLSYTDLTEMILKENKKAMNTPSIFKKICDLLELSEEDIQMELNKRRPGTSALTTSRQEGDKIEILSGIFEGKTDGTPITGIVYNTNQKSKDYQTLKTPQDRGMEISAGWKNMESTTTTEEVVEVAEPL